MKNYLIIINWLDKEPTAHVFNKFMDAWDFYVSMERFKDELHISSVERPEEIKGH